MVQPKTSVGHAGEPLQQVDRMNRLVHECATAVEREPALPSRVVLFRPMPLHVGAARYQPAESSGVDRSLQRLRSFAEARLENRADEHSRLLCCTNDLVGACDGRLDGLFDHEMLARTNRSKRGFEVQSARCRDADCVDIGVREEFSDTARSECDIVLARE